MALCENVILTDIDGVVLNWMAAFDPWMQSQGYTLMDTAEENYDICLAYDIPKAEAKKQVFHFNESANMAFLPPLRDAVRYMKKIHEEKGYVFHAITSQTSNDYAKRLRIMNLKNLFGLMLFEKFIILDCGADKNDALEPYRGTDCLWVEDKIQNALLGQEMGLDSILMMHGHNKQCDKIPQFRNWKEIYEIV